MVPDLGPPGSLTLQPHTAGISSNDHTLQPHLRSSLHPLSRFLFVLRSKDLPKCQLQTYQIIKCSSLYMLYVQMFRLSNVLLWRWRRKDGRWHCSRRMQYTRSGGIHADTPGLHGRFLDRLRLGFFSRTVAFKTLSFASLSGALGSIRPSPLSTSVQSGSDQTTC